MSMQLALRGVEGARLTGEPQSSFFSTVYCSCSSFLLKFKENQFLSSVGYGYQQTCKVKYHGDIALSHFIKITLPNLFVPTYGWCYPKPSTEFTPTMYFLDAQNNVLESRVPRDVTLFYNTEQPFWIPENIRLNEYTFSIDEPPTGCVALGFTSTDHALFWGFKKYKTFNETFYIFDRFTPEFSIIDSGWVNSYMKYFRQYKDNVCAELIERADLIIGGQLIESLTSEYFSIYNTLMVPQQLDDTVTILQGGTSVPIFSDVTYYMYIPFSLTAIPICALTYHEVEIQIKFRKFTDMVPSEYLNGTQREVSDPHSEKVIYTGSNVYSLQSSQYGGIVPHMALLANKGNIYTLSSTLSNLVCIHPVTNTYTTFDLRTVSQIRESVGFVKYLGFYYNFTPNGTIQKIGDRDIRLGRAIGSVYRFGDILFITNDTETYTANFVGHILGVYPRYGKPVTYVERGSQLYFSIEDTGDIYIYDGSNIRLFKKGGGVYFAFINDVFTPEPHFIKVIGQNVIFSNVTGTFWYRVNNTKSTAIRILEHRITYAIGSATTGALILQSGTNVYLYIIGNLTSSLVATDCSIFIEDEYISTDFKIYEFKDNRFQVYSVPNLPHIYANTISYDGEYIYIPPSNGFHRMIRYSIDDNTYSMIEHQPMYVSSSTIDGYKLYMTSNSDTIITYTKDAFSETNFVLETDTVQNYISERVSDLISIKSNLYMFSSNSIYRYNTARTGPPSIESYTLPHSNTLCAFASDDSVSFVSSNPRVDGTIRMFSNGHTTKTNLTSLPPLGTYSSYAFNGSNVVLCGSNLLSISMVDPSRSVHFNRSYAHSNVVVSAGSNVYIFPVSQVLTHGGIQDMNFNIPLPRPISSVYDGTKFIYTTDGSNLVRFNTTLDTFTDLSGYRLITSGDRPGSGPWEAYGSNIISFENGTVRAWNAGTQTFLWSQAIQGEPLHASYILNNTYAFATVSNVVLSDGNVVPFTGVNSVHLGTQNLVFMTSNSYYVTDRSMDILGTGRYETNVHPFTITTPNVVAHFNSNIYFMSRNVVSYSRTLNTWSNIDTSSFASNVYTATYEYESNLFFLPTTGNALFSVDSTNTLHNQMSLVNSNISGAYGYSKILYLSSNTSTNVQALNLTTQALQSHTINQRTLGVHGYGTNVYFSTTTGNIVAYAPQYQNFTDRRTYAYQTTLPPGANVITAAYQNYILSSVGIHNVLTEEFIPIYDILNPDIYGFRDSGGNTVRNTPTEDNTSRKSFIIAVFIGNMAIDQTLELRTETPCTMSISGETASTISPGPQVASTQFTLTRTSTGSQFQSIQIAFIIQFSNVTIIRDGLPFTGSNVYIAPDSPYKVPFANVTTEGTMVSTDASVFFDISSGVVRKRWTPMTTYYRYAGQRTVFNTPIIFFDRTQSEVVTRIQGTSGIAGISAATFTWRSDNILDITRNVVNQVSDHTITFTPVPSQPVTSTVTSIYATSQYTYVSMASGQLYAFHNMTGDVQNIPVEHYGITQVNRCVHAEFTTSVTIFIVTNNYTRVWRFDEDANTTLVHVQVPGTDFNQVNPSFFITFKIENGVCILNGSTLYGFGINKPYSTTVQPVKYSVYKDGFLLIFTTDTLYRYSGLFRSRDVQGLNNRQSLVSSPTVNRQPWMNGSRVFFVDGTTLHTMLIDGSPEPMNFTIPWMSTTLGTLDSNISYISSSVSMNVAYIYYNSSFSPYRTIPVTGGTTVHKSSLEYSNIYMYSTNGDVHRYDMSSNVYVRMRNFPDTVSFYTNGYFVSDSNIYFGSGTYKHSDVPTRVIDVSQVRKYLVITQSSRLMHFDTETNQLITRPLTISCSTRGNIYVNSSNITVYDASLYSRIGYTVIPGSKGVREKDAAYYYMTDTTMFGPTVYTSNPGSNAYGTLFDGSNVYYVYTRGTDLDIWMNGTCNTIPHCTPTHVSIDMFTVYASNVNTLHRLRLATGDISVNSDGIEDVHQSIGVRGNVYMLSGTSSLLYFDQTTDPYAEFTLGAPITCLGFSESNVYIQTQSNIITYRTSSRFDAPSSYTDKKSIGRSGYRHTFENYFVSDSPSNVLVSFDGTSSSIPSYGNVVVRDTQGSIFFANNASTTVTKWMSTPTANATFFSNIIHFTNATTIRSLVFNGGILHVLTSDGVYALDVSTYDDKEYILPLTLRIDTGNYTTGYFDGRYVVCIGGGQTFQYDTIPFEYPIFVAPSIISEYAYIDAAARRRLIEKEHTFLVRQIQSVELTDSNVYYKVDFLNMLRELIVYPRNGTRVRQLDMYLNGHLNVSVSGDYMRNQLMLTHTRIPRSNIYTYSFCDTPELNEPSGHLNASRIRDKTFRIQWDGSESISLYGITYNVFKIKHGLSGLVFNSSPRIDV